MVAQLFKAHQSGRPQALALNAFTSAIGPAHLFELGLVERGLFAGQGTIQLHFEFFGQVRNNAFVGFESAQRANQ